MRPWLRVLIVCVLAGCVVLSAMVFAYRGPLVRQWHCYQVGTAETLDRARQEIAWFETGADREARIAELVRTWGTGNARFDLHLARYLYDPAGSDLLRERFAGELGRREEALPRWARWWAYRAPEEPDRHMASILGSLEVLATADPPRTITWREVLDLQAVFQLTGKPRRARGLTPTNWQDHYRVWNESRPDPFPHVARPEQPFD
ncbi:MAG: hypothetical protein JXB62_01225 [Pirellulales bacterium]|nr:hypothetical protein [Pirellulales bacterium]